MRRPQRTFFNDVVFIGIGEGDGARLMAMKRDNYQDQRFFEEPQAKLLQPAIGQETIYVAGGRLWAVDVNFWQGVEVIWQSPIVNDVTAPPVYAFPGVIRTAELYVADASTNVYALDANTGAEVWRYFVGAQVNTLAVNDASLFISGSGQLRAVSRQTGQTIWTVQTGSLLSGGPLVTADRVMVVTQSGAVLMYDAATGTVIATTSLPGIINAAPAVSLEWLFSPSGNAILGYRGCAVIEGATPSAAPRRPGWDVFLLPCSSLPCYRSSVWRSRRRCPTAYRMCCATRCWGCCCRKLATRPWATSVRVPANRSA
jgi:hypothetical protein